MPTDGTLASPASTGCGQCANRADTRPRRAVANVAILILLAVGALAGARAAGESPLHLELAQANRGDAPRISLAATIVAEAARQTALPIRIGTVDGLPRNSFLRVRGLPPTVSLTEGHAIAPGAWVVPLFGLSSLAMNVPAGISGRSELVVSLIGEDGTLLTEAKAVLVIEPPQPAPAAPPAPLEPPRAQIPPAAPRAQAPVLSPAERESAEKLIGRGERELEQGNIAQARQFFLRAAQSGYARGAMLLAATYDPRELARLRAVGVQPNLAEARKWYERARELGAPEAEERLARLGSGG